MELESNTASMSSIIGSTDSSATMSPQSSSQQRKQTMSTTITAAMLASSMALLSLLFIYQIFIASPSFVATYPNHLPMLSDTCSYLLFASMGTAVNLSSAISGGPLALLFALLVLCVHLVVTLLVTDCGMSLGRRGIECLTKDVMDGGTNSTVNTNKIISWDVTTTSTTTSQMLPLVVHPRQRHLPVG